MSQGSLVQRIITPLQFWTCGALKHLCAEAHNFIVFTSWCKIVLRKSLWPVIPDCPFRVHLADLSIQGETHDSIEDARTALQLYRKFLELSRGGGMDEVRKVLKGLYEKGRQLDWKVPESETGDGQGSPKSTTLLWMNDTCWWSDKFRCERLVKNRRSGLKALFFLHQVLLCFPLWWGCDDADAGEVRPTVTVSSVSVVFCTYWH